MEASRSPRSSVSVPGASAVGFGSLWVAEPDAGCRGASEPRGRIGDGPDLGRFLAGGRGGRRGFGVGDERRRRHREQDPAGADEVTQTTRRAARDRRGSTSAAVRCGSPTRSVGLLLRIDITSGRDRAGSAPRSALGCGVHAGRRVGLGQPGGISRSRPVHLDRDVHGECRRRTDGRAASVRLDLGRQLISTAPSLGSSPRPARELATIQVGDSPNALGAAAGSLWVANGSDDSISEIDPATNAIEQPLPVGGAACVPDNGRRQPLAGRRRIGVRTSWRDRDHRLPTKRFPSRWTPPSRTTTSSRRQSSR